MSQPLVVGLIGFGNIGAGVVRLLAEHAGPICARLPRPIRLKTIADQDVTTPRNAPYDAAQLKNNAAAVLDDPQIEVVVELVGGLQPARTFVERALASGKHVVTANKALLAVHGPELLALAASKGVGLLFEAAVGGGIPIIRALQQGLSANRLTGVRGIFNGTCNYILTQMEERGVTFEEALAEAQAHGYAEPDPTFDIAGIDTAHKTAILASLAFETAVHFDDVYVEGITHIQPVDIRYARELGYAIKLLGIAKRDQPAAAIEVRVHPTLVPLESPLGRIGGVFNGILIDGRPIGPTLYYGQGAGADATSSAIVSDLMAIAADAAGYNPWRDGRLRLAPGDRNIRPMDELETRYYIRFTMSDRPGAMATLGRALADEGVSIESMIQHKAHDGASDGAATISIVTHQAIEAHVQAAIANIEAHEMSAARAFILRVEG
jgi:homoserine dehydrogenase